MPYEHTTAVFGGLADKISAGREGGGRALKALEVHMGSGERRKVFVGCVPCILCCAGPKDMPCPQPAVRLRRDSAAPSSCDTVAGLRGQDIKQGCPWDQLCVAHRRGQAVFLTSLNHPAQKREVRVLWGKMDSVLKHVSVRKLLGTLKNTDVCKFPIRVE